MPLLAAHGLEIFSAISSSLTTARIRQQLAANRVHRPDENDVDILVLDQMLDGFVKVAVPGGEKERAPLPVSVPAHEMKRKADVNGFLLNQFKLLPSLWMDDWATAPSRRPIQQALLKPIKLHPDAWAARWGVGECAMKGIRL